MMAPGRLTDVSPSSLAAAVRANLDSLNRHMSHSAAAEVDESGGLFRWRTPVPHAYYNGVLCFGSPGAGAADAARAVVEYFRVHQVAACSWWPAPGLPLEEWSPHLLPHGFVADWRLPGMALDLDSLSAPPPTGLDIRLVEDPEAIAVWARTFVGGYEVSAPWEAALIELHEGLHTPGSAMRSYLGFHDGVPVATSTMFLGAGVAGIYDVAALPSARGRGFGAAMTIAPLFEARALGYRAAVLQASPQGFPVYERLGFRPTGPVEHFLWSRDGSAEAQKI